MVRCFGVVLCTVHRIKIFTTNERSSINLYLLTQIREIVMQQIERKKMVVDWDDVDERPIQ